MSKKLEMLLDKLPNYQTAATVLLILAGVFVVVNLAIIIYRKKPLPLTSTIVAGVTFGAAVDLAILTFISLPVYVQNGAFGRDQAPLFFAGFLLPVVAVFIGTNKVASYIKGPYKLAVKPDQLLLGNVNLWDGKKAINPAFFTMNEKSLVGNIHVLGATRSGKTSAILYPALQQILSDKRKDKKPAALILDIKGGMIDDISKWDHKRKKDIIVIGEGDTNVNILAAGDPQLTANNFVVGLEGFRGHMEPYFRDIQENYLRAALTIIEHFVARDRAIDKAVLDEGAGFDDAEEVFTLRDFMQSDFAKAQVVTLRDLYRFTSSKDLRKAIFTYYRNLTKIRGYPDAAFEGALTEFSAAGTRDYQDKLSGLQTALATLDDKKISSFFGGTKPIDFKSVINEGKIVIVSLPESRFGSVSKLIGLQFMLQYQRAVLARLEPGVEINRDRFCFLFLDEAQNFLCEYLSLFTSRSGQAKVCTMLLHQDLEQIPPSYQTSLFANCRTKIAFSINSFETSKALSDYYGTRKVKKQTISSGSGGGSNQGMLQLGGSRHRSVTVSENIEPRFAPDDFIQMPNGQAIISLFDGQQTIPTFKIQTIPWFKNNLYSQKK